MGKLRKAIASFSMVAILSTLFVTNVASAHWSDRYFDATEAAGVTSAEAERNHNDDISRAEAFTMLVQAMELPVVEGAECPFPDCTGWSRNYLAAAYAAEILAGDKDGMARPNSPIYRHDAVLTLYRVNDGVATMKGSDIFSDVKEDSYAGDAIAWAYENDIAKGYQDGTFGVGRNISRGEFAKMVADAFGYPVAEPEPNPEPNPEPQPEAGDIMVKLSDMSPDIVELPKNATGVTVAAWDFVGEGRLNSLKVHKVGVSNLAGDHQVYLYDKYGNRLTGGKTINSTTEIATFNNLNIDVDGTTTLMLRMDVGDTPSTGTAGFQIKSMDHVTTDADVSGNFPVLADMFGLSTIPVGTATITKNGTVTDAAVGEKGATIAKFKVAAATNNAEVEEIGIYLSGTVNSDDVENFKLYVAGKDEPIAMTEGVNKRDVVRFDLDEPYAIAKGNNRSFWVEADFNTGRTGDTSLIYIDETTDIIVRDTKYGYGMKVDATAYAGSICTANSPTECSAMTLEGGDVTLSGITIAERDIATNAEDAEVLRFTLTAESYVTVDDFTMYLDADAAGEGLMIDASTAAYTDIKISEVDGNHVWGPIDADVLKDGEDSTTVIANGAASEKAPAYYKFTDDLVLEAGQSREFVMTLDVDASANLDGDTLVAAIYIDNDDPKLKDVNNKVLTNSGSLVPTTSYIGDTFTIDSASLTVNRSNEISSDSTMVIGSRNAGLLSLAMGASDSNDVIVTEVNFTGYIDDNGATNLFVKGSDTVRFNEVVQSMRLYHTSIKEENRIKGPNGQTVTASATDEGLISFDNIRWTIPAGETLELLLTGDINNNSTYNTDQVKIDIADVSAHITAENEDGNSVESTSADYPNGGIADDTAAYTQHTISSGGNLSIDVPSTTAVSDIIVAGTTDNAVATLRLTAAQEAFEVSKISLRNKRPDYDDNIASVKVRYYTDEAQTQEKISACSNNGSTVWTCSGMTMMVPNPDTSGNPNYADIDVLVDTKTIAANNDAADAADTIHFTFTPAGDMEARAVDSPAQIEEEEVYVTDLGATATFATVGEYTLQGDAMNGAATASATVLPVDDNDLYYTGSVICLDAGDDGCDADDEKAYVVASCTAVDTPHGDCTADNDLVVRRGIFGTTPAAMDNNDGVAYISPTSVLATNDMMLHGTKLAFKTLVPAHGGQNATEEVMKFSITANANGDAKFRQGDVNDATTNTADFNTPALSGTFTATDALSTVATGGIGATGAFQRETSGGVDGAGIIYTFDAAADLSAYTGMCYSTRASEAANTITATLDDDAGSDQTIASGTLVANEWKQVCGDFDGTTTNYDAVSTITFAVTDASAVAAATYDIDNIILYKEKLTVDLTNNADVTAGGYTSYLKRGNQVVATGYAVWSADSDTGNIQFVPVSPYGEFTINGEQTFTVETDTTNFTNTTNTESLTLNIDLGGYDTNTGDVKWYDEEGGVTVTFAGVSVTDKVSNTLSY